jgi:hypothetical protein
LRRIRNTYKILVENPEEKRLLGRHRCRRENNIRMDLREKGYENLDWLHLAENKGQLRALANTNFRVP